MTAHRVGVPRGPNRPLSPTLAAAAYLIAGCVICTTGACHLPVRVPDGTGLVGPLVIPGKTSCLVNP